MDDYFAAKALLFSDDYLNGRAVINLDDPYGKRLIEQSRQPVWTYSTQQPADLWMSNLTYGAEGVSGTLTHP